MYNIIFNLNSTAVSVNNSSSSRFLWQHLPCRCCLQFSPILY